MHIVVVDPSRTVLKIVTQLLEAGRHEAFPFTDGHEALKYIKSDSEVDALITSVELQSMTGVELCRETRLLATRGRPIYIVLMSSNYEQSKLIEALDSGADDFIGKPPATEELYARLRAAERFATMQRELVRLATTDPLTGVLNRRAFFEQAEEACARAAAGGTLSGIMTDIDHFKCINDAYGHNVGDMILRIVAREIKVKNEIVGRLGGEEFAIVLKERPLAGAVAIAEALRQKLAALRLEAEGKPVQFTGSFGVAEWRSGESVDELLKRADVALYEAKAKGRNRVVAATDAAAAEPGKSGLIRAVAR
jgi:diguanylate cyclase (GGDEF)-like protein